MNNRQIPRPSNIIESFKILKGNTRVSIQFEPLWGIPFVLYNFYLSLYMKEIGVTNQEIGYLIAIGFLAGTIFSMFGGVITDKLGRKKTTLIFDLISWPLVMIIYLFANNFWMFALATVVNSVVRIVAVSWNLMVIEDADNDQRVAAFNLLNIITIATGVIIPIAGILVNAFGVVHGERIFLGLSAVSMTTMMLVRNHYYVETRTGKQILEEHRKNPMSNIFKNALPHHAIRELIKKPVTLMVVCVMVLFNIYITLGGFNSLYFAPYMTEVLSLGKSTISILGGIYSAVLFFIFVFINPVISRLNKTVNMIVGLVIQAVALFLLTTIPQGNLIIASLCVILFAFGFGIFKPFIDSLLAEVTEGKDRAGVYSMINMAICIGTALMGVVSGILYVLNPRMLYFTSIAILLTCVGILVAILKSKEL